METLERVVTWPTQKECEEHGVDAWDLLPKIPEEWFNRETGKRVRVIVQDLDSQEPGECICNTGPGFLCDPECEACKDVETCPP